ncbi:MAG: MEDS domain-containing protein [Sporichthyaceae bacterium]
MIAPRSGRQVVSARHLPPDSHLCWAYSGRADFLERAAEFVADASAQGWRVQYVGVGPHERLREELAGILGGADADAVVYELEEFYVLDGRGIVAPERTVAARVAAVREHGRTTRTVVDGTELVRTQEQREAFARYEYLVDRRLNAAGSAALCAYGAEVLAPAAIAELACLHPFVGPGTAAFRVFAQPGASFALAGVVDRSSRPLFARTLARVLPYCADGTLIVDGRGLAFIDHHGLHTLGSVAQRHGAQVVLRTATRSAAASVVRLLGLQDLIVAEAA